MLSIRKDILAKQQFIKDILILEQEKNISGQEAKKSEKKVRSWSQNILIRKTSVTKSEKLPAQLNLAIIIFQIVVKAFLYGSFVGFEHLDLPQS